MKRQRRMTKQDRYEGRTRVSATRRALAMNSNEMKCPILEINRMECSVKII